MTQKLRVKKCPSCGKDHEITFGTIRGTAEIDGKRYSNMGACENTGEKVYMREVVKHKFASK